MVFNGAIASLLAPAVLDDSGWWSRAGGAALDVVSVSRLLASSAPTIKRALFTGLVSCMMLRISTILVAKTSVCTKETDFPLQRIDCGQFVVRWALQHSGATRHQDYRFPSSLRRVGYSCCICTYLICMPVHVIIHQAGAVYHTASLRMHFLKQSRCIGDSSEMATRLPLNATNRLPVPYVTHPPLEAFPV